MPRLSKWMIRAALLHLGVGWTFGALMLIPLFGGQHLARRKRVIEPPGSPIFPSDSRSPAV